MNDLKANGVEPLSLIQSLSHPSGVRIASKNGLLWMQSELMQTSRSGLAASGVLRALSFQVDAVE